MVSRNFHGEKLFFLQVVIVLTCFQSEKSQNKLDLVLSVLLKCFTIPAKILNLRGSKAKTSHLSIFHSHFACICTKALLYILSRLSASKLLRKTLKITTQACNNERIISSDFKPEVDASLNITLLK